jgi:hypothetical protein
MRGKSIPPIYFDIATIMLVVLSGFIGFVTMKENDAKSVGVGIAIMLFGWGMALLCALAASDRKIRQELSLHASGLPIDQTFDSDSANEAIVHRLSEIEAAYNIRAFIPELEKTYLSRSGPPSTTRPLLLRFEQVQLGLMSVVPDSPTEQNG